MFEDRHVDGPDVVRLAVGVVAGVEHAAVAVVAQRRVALQHACALPREGAAGDGCRGVVDVPFAAEAVQLGCPDVEAVPRPAVGGLPDNTLAFETRHVVRFGHGDAAS